MALLVYFILTISHKFVCCKEDSEFTANAQQADV